jgi:glutathionyl-hydroquinone reductase
MKLMVDGVWHPDHPGGAGLGMAATPMACEAFTGRVTADGSSGFPAQAGRYHLYVSHACPFAHRTMIVRALKKLEDAISVSVLHPRWAGSVGWYFAEGPDSTVDHANGCAFLHEVYALAKPDFTGKVSVPVLWDKETRTIVNAESEDIAFMLNAEFDEFAGDDELDLYPEDLRPLIDDLDRFISDNIVSGVYKAGFATSQQAYDAAFDNLFFALSELETRLHIGSYMFADRLTESDWRLFPTLVRFDTVYYPLFRCNQRRVADYPRLSAYLRRLYEIPGIAETVKFDHIKRHYFDDLGLIDPTIVPRGPALDQGLPSRG